MRKIIALCLVLFLAVCSYAQMDTSLITKDGRTVLTTTSAPGQAVVFTNVGYLQAQSFVLGTNAAVSNWPAGGGAGTTNASGINVAATPNNYTAASPNVESHLAGINDKLGSFTTGAVSTTISVTQDWTFVQSANPAKEILTQNVMTFDGAYHSFSLTSAVPANAVAAQLYCYFKGSNAAGSLLISSLSSNTFMASYNNAKETYQATVGMVPLTTNISALYYSTLQGSNGVTRIVSIQVEGWYIPKTTTYNLPAGGIGTITNDWCYVPLTQTVSYAVSNFVANNYGTQSFTAAAPEGAVAVKLMGCIKSRVPEVLFYWYGSATNLLGNFNIPTTNSWHGNQLDISLSTNRSAIYWQNISQASAGSEWTVLGYYIPKVTTIVGSSVGGNMVSGAVPMAVNSSGGIVWSTNISSSGSSAGTTNASGINVAATPNNYTAASPNVESHLAGINTKLGSFTTGAVSTTIIVTQDCVFVTNTTSALAFTEVNISSNGTYSSLSLSSIVPTNAIMVQVAAQAQFTNSAYLAFYDASSNFVGGMQTMAGIWFYSSFNCPLYANKSIVYWCDGLGANGSTRRISIRIVGWWIPKTTTYNLPSGGIGVISNGWTYVQSTNPIVVDTTVLTNHTGPSYTTFSFAPYVPTNAIAIQMTGYIRSSTPGQLFYFYDKLATNPGVRCIVEASNINSSCSGLLMLDSARECLYYSSLDNGGPGRIASFNICGYYVSQVQAIAGNAIGGTMVSGAVPVAVNSSGGIVWSTNLSSSGAGTTNASGINVAATPNNYTAASPNVESHLSGINTKLGSFTTGAVSTTITVTQDWTFVTNFVSTPYFTESDFASNGAYNVISFTNITPTNAIAVQLSWYFTGTNASAEHDWADTKTNYAGLSFINTANGYGGGSAMVPLDNNRQCLYWNFVKGVNGATRVVRVHLVGWYVPKTTTYNLPAGGIGTITNGPIYVKSGFQNFQINQTSIVHDATLRMYDFKQVGVPAEAIAIEVYAYVTNNASGFLTFRDPAGTNSQFEWVLDPQIAGKIAGKSGLIGVSNGWVCYQSTLVNPELNMRIKGWYIPQTQTIVGSSVGGTVVSGAVPMAVNSSGSVAWSTRLSPLTGMKNRIINGDFKVWQRGTNLTLTGANAGAYLADRWSSGYASTTLPTMRVDRVTSAGCPGLEYAYKITAAPKAATSDFRPYTYQQIEGYNVSDLMWGTASALPVTISFWVKGTLSGSYGLCLADGAWTKTYVTDYVINQANVWENKTLTIPGCTNGVAWYKDSSVGLGILFDLGAGTGNTEKAGTNNVWCDAKYASTNTVNFFGGNNSLYLTGVQLEKGSIATDFEFRSYGQEFTLCQRYYEVMGGVGADANPTYAGLLRGYSMASTYADATFMFAVPKRSIPVLTKNGTWAVVNCAQPSLQGASIYGMEMYSLVTATGMYALYANSADDTIEIKAEY